MTESDMQRENESSRETEGKKVAYYQVLLTAWIGTRMERDKTIITISSVAIGLLVTILTKTGVTGFWLYLSCGISVLGFLLAIVICLFVYRYNASHLEEVLQNRDATKTGKLLNILDVLSDIAFYVGILCMVWMAATISFQKWSLNMKESGKPKNEQQIHQGSFTGVKKLSPQNVRKHSLSGINNLSPQNLQPAPPNPPKREENTADSNETSGGKNSGAKEGE